MILLILGKLAACVVMCIIALSLFTGGVCFAAERTTVNARNVYVFLQILTLLVMTAFAVWSAYSVW